VKLNNTFILFDAGGISKSSDWRKAHEAIENAVKGMSWPADSENGLVIPRIVSIKNGATYTDRSGKFLVWKNPKDHTLRNGLEPVKLLFP